MNYKYTQVVKYGLKAQKLLAQGSALGIMVISKAPCKVGCSKSINFSTRFCTEIQVNSHEINVLRIQKCNIF